MASKEVEIDFCEDDNKFDECNALVLPGKKIKPTKSKNKLNNVEKKVVLSKKKRKKLEKILERKNKKLNRTKLISDLKEFQVKEKQYDLMPSTSVIQTAGRKRINDLIKLYNVINVNEENGEKPNFDHRKLKIPKINLKCNEKNFNRRVKNTKDLNVVGLEMSSEDEEEEEESADETKSSCSDSDHETESTEKCVNNESEKKEVTVVPKVEEKVISTPKVEIKKEIKKSVYLTVNRVEEIQNRRLKLPILTEEHRIMEEIMYNPVVIICGETGSGKTTQVPQFLYEGGYTMNGKMIGITEPRRVAAISMAKRVAHELNLTLNEVSYQIRFDGTVTDKTMIKFMTDGILMKEIQHDFLLRKYSAIVIDEAHERSLYSDILIGFLSRVVKTRQKQGDPLKLIIMSATLRVEDFTENKKLFIETPPVIKIDARQFPVSVHFSKRTNPNYLREAFKKVCKIHSSLPPGGILVFLTGRQEVNSLCRMLKEKFPFNNISKETVDKEGNVDEKSSEENVPIKDEKQNSSKVPMVNLDCYSVEPTESERIMDDLDYSDDEFDKENLSEDEFDYDDEEMNGVTTDEPLYCLPLYSMLPNHKQALVFKNPPPGCRLCVIATNVAETSLTIPNIKYVIDTGKIKNKVFDTITGISTFIVEWTSKASADQRAGRAGRTSAGHCYRLYSSAVYNDQFKKYSIPEILAKPIDDLMLQMKAIGIDNVANFPFPSPPKIESLLAAEKRLIFLEALKEENVILKGKKIVRSFISSIGKVMATFPVNPRYSKMLCLSSQSNLLPFTIAIISALTVQEIFIYDEGKQKNAFFSNPLCLQFGDLLAILNAVGAANNEGLSAKFCEHYGLRYSAMVEINKLRMQLSQQIKEINKEANVSTEISQPPNQEQIRLLRQLFLCGFTDHVAKRVPIQIRSNNDDLDENGPVTKKPRSGRYCYQSTEVVCPIFISPHSALSNETPPYVVYHDIFESTKMYMRTIVPIEPEWLPIYASKHCNFSNPLNHPPPRYDEIDDKVKCYRTSTFGPHNWQLPAVESEYPECFDKYRHFALFLLSGNVLKWFDKYSKILITPPIVITKPWAFIQPKVDQIVNALTCNKINSKKALKSKWKSEQSFLLNEYLEWIPESQKEKIRSTWPPTN